MTPQRYNKASGQFVARNYNVTISGDGIWRDTECTTDLIGPKFIRGGFFVKTDRVILELVEEKKCRMLNVLCFDYFRVLVDKVQMFSEVNICFGHNDYCNWPQYHHLTIDLRNKTIDTAPYIC